MVLTVIPEGIDLLLSEKQSMAQIVCNELAQLTWRSSADLFVFRLTQLRDLSESWQQFDQASGIECAADEESPTEASEVSDGKLMPVQTADKENAMIKASGIVTRSKRSTNKTNSYGKVGATSTQRAPNISVSKKGGKQLVHVAKRRGRPPGSKNTPKKSVQLLKVKEEQHSDSDTDIAEPAESDDEQGSTPAGLGNISTAVQSDEGSDDRVTRVENEPLSKCRRSKFTAVSVGKDITSATTEPVCTCNRCGENFASKRLLSVHRRICGIQRNEKASLSKGIHSCGNCGRKFRYLRSMQKHQQHACASSREISGPDIVDWLKMDPQAAQEMVELKVFTCTECDNMFNDIMELGIHMRIHAERCSIKSDVQLPTEDSNAVFTCISCDRNFTSKAELMAHLEENLGSHECSDCGRRIKGALWLRVHRLVHKSSTRELYSKFKPCKSRPIADDKSDFKLPHSRTTLPVTGSRFVCHVCAKSLSSNKDLRRHVWTHEGDRRFECARCGMRFLLHQSLQRHVRAVHMKQRPNLCNLCGRSFAEKHQLKTHIKAHARNSSKFSVKPFAFSATQLPTSSTTGAMT